MSAVGHHTTLGRGGVLVGSLLGVYNCKSMHEGTDLVRFLASDGFVGVEPLITLVPRLTPHLLLGIVTLFDEHL